jgi:hypothetical protein
MGRSLICVGSGRRLRPKSYLIPKNERERNLLHRQTPLRQQSCGRTSTPLARSVWLVQTGFYFAGAKAPNFRCWHYLNKNETSMTVFNQTDRHPEIPSMRARRLQRPNRVEGPFVLAGKHKVSQGYSPADENAGLAYALRDDVFVIGLNNGKLKRYYTKLQQFCPHA